MLGKVMSKSELMVYNACKAMVQAVEEQASKIDVDLIEGGIISEKNGDAYVSFMSIANGNTKYAMHKLDVYELISLSPEKLRAYMDDIAGRLVSAIYNQHHNDNRIPYDEVQHEGLDKNS